MYCSVGLAWGYGFLAVTIISCASLCGAFVVPFMSKDIYKILLLFMVSLAVGVLCGSGIFHLIPAVSSVSYSFFEYSFPMVPVYCTFTEVQVPKELKNGCNCRYLN